MKKWAMGCAALAAMLLLCAFAGAEQGDLRYVQLKTEQRIYDQPSESAWVTGRPDAGQICCVTERGDGAANGWAHVTYLDRKTRISGEGWLRCMQDVAPYDFLLADSDAEEAARRQLTDFCTRVDVRQAAPDYVFPEAYVGEAFRASAAGVVDGGEIHVRVELDGTYAAENFTHFVVVGRGSSYRGGAQTPIARLNATARSEETGLNVRFEGVAPYLPGAEAIEVYPVYAGQAELDYARCMALRPEGSLTASGDGAHRMTGRPHKNLPMMDFTFTDTGETSADDERIMQVLIKARDGSLSQSFTYPTYENGSGMGPARLVDVNFDGYLDLELVHAVGASNGFSIFSLWLPDEGRFAEDVDSELRFCNYELDGEAKTVRSTERDGAASYHTWLYAWENGTEPTLLGESETYSTGDPSTIGERVIRRARDGSVEYGWDETYPADWYTASRVWNERSDVMDAVLLHGTRGHRAVVANVDWVNLRRQDSKQSPSIAKLDAGTEVEILAYGCGEDRGWIRVYVRDSEARQGRTGYIWKTYLQEIN